MKKGFAPRELVNENRPAVWMAPLLAIVTLFYLYPAFEVLRFSFTNSNLLQQNYDYTFGTYVRTLGDSVLYDVIWTTAVFVIASVVLQLALGLLIAVAANRARRRKLPGMVFMRSVILSAWVMPGVVIGIVWAIVLNEASYGLANLLLSTVGIGSVAWLSNPNTALVSIIVANVWRGTAFSMILQYAGLQSIPDELYEAAEVDGAGALQSFWYITIPQLKPIILINIILITISTLNTFDMILPLTGGGPGRATEVLSLRTYNVIFGQFSLAGGAVLAVIMLAISLGLTLGYRRLLRSEGTV
ncbi:MAG: ABC transporter, permease protein 1 (cluster 1, maltose/g3p/polyamine/iron) [uncultured Rubrobacteraceae bacterium]|uniref:ABC transporter, permease protein 1 (Cluster 1, maltose/g3p/polyamine/iron) n=1 Tax=uncultured Rubrobacteraceae bacterium TaxID=349277 RepID=A0A6J4R9U0_9ACTN|nr:MAG: ABC transporter, permease protein 1 (cluster 1, maltose/g3p/polyamine/iron) [uncultured Rubrobacteraceae bacterium]